MAALVDGEAVAIFRTHDGNVYAIANYDPVAQRLGAVPRHRRHPRRRSPLVASPMHKQAFDLRTGQCLDDAAVRVPTYDVRVDRTAWCTSGPDRQPGESVTDLPLSRLPDRRHRGPEGRRAGHAARAARRRGRVGAGAVGRPEPRRRRAAGGHRGGAGAAGRPVPGDHRHRHEGVVRGGRGVGAAADRCSRRSGAAEILARGPKSVGALRRRGLRELWAPESECFEDVLAHLRGRDLAGLRIVVQEHGQSLSMVAHALRRQGADVTTVTVYRVESRGRPGADVPADRPGRRPSPRRRDLHLRSRGRGADGCRRPRPVAATSVVAAFQADVVASCVGPVTAAAFEMWGVPTIFPDRSRLVAMVKQLETELPSRSFGTTLEVAGHTAAAARRRRCCSTASRSKLSPAPFARPAGAARQPRPRRLPARAAGRAAVGHRRLGARRRDGGGPAARGARDPRRADRGQARLPAGGAAVMRLVTVAHGTRHATRQRRRAPTHLARRAAARAGRGRVVRRAVRALAAVGAGRVRRADRGGPAAALERPPRAP